MMNIKKWLYLMEPANLAGVIIALSGQRFLMRPVRAIIRLIAAAKVACCAWVLTQILIVAFGTTEATFFGTIRMPTVKSFRFATMKACDECSRFLSFRDGLALLALGNVISPFFSFLDSFHSLRADTGIVAIVRTKEIHPARFIKFAWIEVKQITAGVTGFLYSFFPSHICTITRTPTRRPMAQLTRRSEKMLSAQFTNTFGCLGMVLVSSRLYNRLYPHMLNYTINGGQI